MVDYEDLFNTSYWRVTRAKKDGDRFFDAFYRRFLDSSPAVRDKFNHTDMEIQKQTLQESLNHMCDFYVSNVADDHIQEISQLHSKADMDIAPHLYDLWLECLIETVREYDPEVRPDVELAWRLVMISGITYMKFHYDETSHREAPA